MSEIDLDAIRERAEKATPGPWEAGDVWYTAGLIFDEDGQRVGAKDGVRCAYCHFGEPVKSGRMDINGTRMRAHLHHTDDPYEPEHRISGADGATVAGNYDDEVGGIIDPADTAFIAHAREDIPALLAEVERLRESVDRHRHFATAAANATNEMRVQRDDAREELATAQKKLHAVATTKVWTNEDGRRFMFASDLAAACLGTDGEATS